MANNLCKKLCLVFIFLSIFFVSFIHGSPSLDRNASERNMGMKKSGGSRREARGSGGGARGGTRGSGGGRAGMLPYGTVIPLHGGSGGHKSHGSSAVSQGSYCSLALVLVAAAVGAAIL